MRNIYMQQKNYHKRIDNSHSS